jgi:UDP-3-O-[3-hydroxymyristoyl] N-acetylglucosamine deacetylase
MYWQKTVKEEINFRSVGLHSGRKVGMTIKPAEADTGIVFVRRDVSDNNRIAADIQNVTDTTLATTLGVNGTRVHTVEHLLSAFRGLGIDNAIVEVDTFEVPIMDGSSQPFVNTLKSVGLKALKKPRRYLRVKKAVSVSEGESMAALEPASDFRITYKIDFPHPAVGTQTYHMVFSADSYDREISSARTFGFLRDVEYLQAKGLALGGSLQNAVVLDDEKVINKEGLRSPDEFVKHKILDAIGDLYLLGMPIIGHFTAYKSGHKLNTQLLKALLACEDCWEIVSHPHTPARAHAHEESVPDLKAAAAATT